MTTVQTQLTDKHGEAQLKASQQKWDVDFASPRLLYQSSENLSRAEP